MSPDGVAGGNRYNALFPQQVFCALASCFSPDAIRPQKVDVAFLPFPGAHLVEYIHEDLEFRGEFAVCAGKRPTAKRTADFFRQ